MLKENISNLPVIIVEKSVLYEILDNDFLNNIDNILSGKYLPNSNNYKFRIIPYSSLGNENGILIGVKPDYIKVYIEEEYQEREAIIGIYKGKLSGRFDEYNAIIGL